MKAEPEDEDMPLAQSSPPPVAKKVKPEPDESDDDDDRPLVSLNITNHTKSDIIYCLVTWGGGGVLR